MAITEEEAKWLFSKLRSINFMQSINLDNVDKIIRRIEKYSFPKGKAIIKEGQEGMALFIVSKGKVAVTKKKGLFGKLHIADIGPGGFFGEMSLVTDNPCAATVTAAEPVELFVLMKETFRSQLSSNPELLQEIKYIIEKRKFEIKEK